MVSDRSEVIHEREERRRARGLPAEEAGAAADLPAAPAGDGPDDAREA
jgi:hypothetical protein